MWNRESVARWCRCVCKSGTCARRMHGCAVSCAKRAPRARPRRCPEPTRGCASRCGYRSSARRRWRRRWPRLARAGRYCRSRCTVAGVSNRPSRVRRAAAASSPGCAAMGASRGRRWRNGSKCTRRQPRRACVTAAASRMWPMASVPPRSLRSMYKPHKRRIRRPRWRRACDCADSPREVAAPAPHRLFAHTPYGTTVWACVLFERFVCHRR